MRIPSYAVTHTSVHLLRDMTDMGVGRPLPPTPEPVRAEWTGRASASAVVPSQQWTVAECARKQTIKYDLGLNTSLQYVERNRRNPSLAGPYRRRDRQTADTETRKGCLG